MKVSRVDPGGDTTPSRGGAINVTAAVTGLMNNGTSDTPHGDNPSAPTPATTTKTKITLLAWSLQTVAAVSFAARVTDYRGISGLSHPAGHPPPTGRTTAAELCTRLRRVPTEAVKRPRPRRSL